MNQQQGSAQRISVTPGCATSDPEDRLVDAASLRAIQEKTLDKTIADSFPASDPPSSLPNPVADCFAIEHRRET